MKNIVSEIQTNGEGAVSILNTQQDEQNVAESGFYSVLAAAAISNVAVHTCVVFTNEGNIVSDSNNVPLTKSYNHSGDNPKYIVFELQTDANGNVGILHDEYTDRNEAEGKYHTVLGYAATSQLPAHAALLITNEGFKLMSKCYKHNA